MSAAIEEGPRAAKKGELQIQTLFPNSTAGLPFVRVKGTSSSVRKFETHVKEPDHEAVQWGRKVDIFRPRNTSFLAGLRSHWPRRLDSECIAE